MSKRSDANKIDKALRCFGKTHPVAKKQIKKTPLDRFVLDIEKQLDKMEKKKR